MGGDTTGLTPFLIAMMKTPKDRLVRANTDKLARKYGIPDEWAAWYIAQWVRGNCEK